MRIFKEFMRDESGLIMSAEAVMVGTVGVLGATVGLSALAQSVNDELTEVAFAFRSLDQSFSYEGSSCCSAQTAGSRYTQRPVEESINDLCAQIEEAKKNNRENHKRPAPQPKKKRSKKSI